MNCQEYLRQFSDYFDGRANAETSRAMEDHRSTCVPCRRYAEALESGAAELRSLPDLELPPDFRARLDHRIFHIEDGPSIARESLGTGASTVSILAVAALLAVSAWAPVVGTSHPLSELPPVIVEGPPASLSMPDPARPTFSRSRSGFVTAEFQDGVWGDPHQLFREYSSFSERRRSQTAVRLGSQ